MLAKDITPARFERFWSKIDTSSGINGCWPYRGYHDPNGYGKFGVGERRVWLAHRFAFISILGDLPPHLPFLLHKCPGGGNSWCNNPAHQCPGTQQENLADAVRTQRIAVGERHGSAKLTAADVLAIRAARAAGVAPKLLAVQYGVNRAYISEITSRTTWRHI